MSDEDDTERLVADIDADLKARAKADPRTIREITESALKREFRTGATAAVERRIEEKRSRINQIRIERNERERELAEQQDELKRLENQLESYEQSHDSELQEAFSNLETIDEKGMLDASNPAVQKQAEKLGMTPEGLINEYNDEH